VLSGTFPDARKVQMEDLPDAEMHRLDSGHFAVEDCLNYIATNIHRFHDEKVDTR
jgi:hypothetical protein